MNHLNNENDNELETNESEHPKDPSCSHTIESNNEWIASKRFERWVIIEGKRTFEEYRDQI